LIFTIPVAKQEPEKSSKGAAAPPCS